MMQQLVCRVCVCAVAGAEPAPRDRPQEHVQRSTNGGANGRRRLHFLLSKFSSVDLRSTDVTLFA